MWIFFSAIFGNLKHRKPEKTTDKEAMKDRSSDPQPLRTAKSSRSSVYGSPSLRQNNDDIMSNPLHPLNPLNPLSPISPVSIYNDPSPIHSSPPSCDSSSSSYSSGSSSYDSGSSSCDSSSSSSSDSY